MCHWSRRRPSDGDGLTLRWPGCLMWSGVDSHGDSINRLCVPGTCTDPRARKRSHETTRSARASFGESLRTWLLLWMSVRPGRAVLWDEPSFGGRVYRRLRLLLGRASRLSGGSLPLLPWGELAFHPTRRNGRGLLRHVDFHSATPLPHSGNPTSTPLIASPA